MSPYHIAVLDALAGLTQPNGEMCVPFRAIEEDTGLSRDIVRRSCRYLARKGLAEYHRALWSDDGPAGSGYCISVEGMYKLEKPYE